MASFVQFIKLGNKLELLIHNREINAFFVYFSKRIALRFDLTIEASKANVNFLSLVKCKQLWKSYHEKRVPK